jgi:type I restriction enzyme, S subunit
MSDSNQHLVPSGWAKVRLHDVVRPIRSKVRPSDLPDLRFIGMEHVEAHTTRLLGTIEASMMKSSAVRFEAGDVLYGRLRPYLNKVHLAEFTGLCSAEFIALTPYTGIDARLVSYLLNSWRFVSFASGLNAGIDRPRVDFEGIADYEFAIPPLPEQRRIVEKVDSLLSKLEAATAGLQRAAANLKRYRSSVLNAAVEGRLVPTEAELARKEGRDFEPASVLLDRILAERRRRWEESELARMKAAGKPPKDDRWKSKYKQPTAPNTTALPRLPEGWCWATIDQLAALVRNGYSHAPTEASGVPILRISAVRPMSLDLKDIRFLPGQTEQYSDFLVENGDLLFTRYNGTRSLVGVCALAREVPSSLAYPDKLIKVKTVVPGIVPEFIEIAANSGFSREHMEFLIRTTAGQSGISGTDVKRMPLPLPPFDEQRRVVADVDEKLSIADETLRGLERSLAQCERLRQSILKWAFEGKLADQDPNDEPASVLLERILAERHIAMPSRKGSKRTALEAEAAK